MLFEEEEGIFLYLVRLLSFVLFYEGGGSEGVSEREDTMISQSMDGLFPMKVVSIQNMQSLNSMLNLWVDHVILQLYKQNLINFDSVQRNWLAPYSWERRWNEYKEPYQQPTWTTSAPRRYFLSFGS